MRKTIRRSLAWAFGIITAIFTFVPESFFGIFMWIPERTIQSISWLHTMYNEVNIVINRIIVFLCVWLFVFIIYALAMRCRRSVNIKGKNYSIRVEYGDLFKAKKCKRVINFDECFTTKVGPSPANIKEDSICGQYLMQNPVLDVPALISASGVKPSRRKSKYRNLTCYEPGTIVPNGDNLLMAFTRLEESGSSKKFTVAEYLDCLSRLWEEIDKYYCNKEVCVPILGSGLARFENGNSSSIPKQELVDLMITSYKLSPHKLKSNNALHIVCWKPSNDFSMDNVIG